MSRVTRRGACALGAALLLAAAAFPQAQASTEGQALYSAVSGSVVYLQHEIRLNASDCKKPELWRRYESLAKHPFLDAAFPLVSGSGFFIDDRGYILTNRHVADFSPEVWRYWVVGSMATSLEKNWGSLFSKGDRDAMMADFKVMIDKGRYDFAVYSGATRYVATILAKSKDKEPDLALLKVEGSGFRALRLALPEAIVPGLAGADVYSLGFPLGNSLEEMLEFKERTVTMNRGAISAIRNNNLSIQHSAAVSHGNSGGPLVDSQGIVLGLNTVSLQEVGGNSLFYAVDSGKVHDFLDKLGFGELLAWNRRLPGALASRSSVKLNALGEIEVSGDLLIDADKGVEVLVGGADLGSGPQFVKLSEPVTRLELHGPSGDFSGKLRLLSSLTGATTLRPALMRRETTVAIDSEPAGATVVADGKLLGQTPLEVDLAPDSYALSFRREGAWFADRSLVVAAGERQELSVKGETPRAVTLIAGPAEPAAKLRFESSAGVIIYSQGEPLALADGAWKLSVEGSPALAGASVPLTVSGSPVSLDLGPYKRNAALQVRGLGAAAELWIDDKPMKADAGDSLALPLGVHSVYAWEKGLEPLPKTRITVRDDGKSFVTWDRLPGHDVKTQQRFWAGIGLGISGAALAGAGLVFNQNSVIMGMTDSFSSYQLVKLTTGAAALTGCGLIVGAIFQEIESVKERRLLQAEEEYRKSLEAQNE
jgi:Trypsin-like serine proteases, typically periplasmic, contain C-terminal PDZ domain